MRQRWTGEDPEYELEVKRCFAGLTRANRELRLGMERFAECQVSPLPGHIAEMRRRLVALQEAADDAILKLGG